MRSSDFVNHSYDYRPNWTPLSPVTITNFPKLTIKLHQVSYNLHEHVLNDNRIITSLSLQVSHCKLRHNQHCENSFLNFIRTVGHVVYTLQDKSYIFDLKSS